MQHRRAIFTIVLLLSLLSPRLGAAQTLLRVATPGGRADAYIRFMLAKVGLDYRTDAQIIPLSGGSSVLCTISYEDPAFLSIPPYKFFDLSLIQELKTEAG